MRKPYILIQSTRLYLPNPQPLLHINRDVTLDMLGSTPSSSQRGRLLLFILVFRYALAVEIIIQPYYYLNLLLGCLLNFHSIVLISLRHRLRH
ncbi:hypothetical protein V1517DRAFT_333034 [Lipomyces orientalis]|uniref:Uncharacterized protein n=1 Tax=Lipomyces orientalis TaxID=1233043 RepID=A0ACC3TE94_9ASCO